jgi:hypothetical protein
LDPSAADIALYEARRQRFIEMHGPDVPMPEQRARDTDRDLLEPRARGPVPSDVDMGLLGHVEYDDTHQGRNELIRQLMGELREAEQLQELIVNDGNPDDPQLRVIGRRIQEIRGIIRNTIGIEPEEIGDILGGTRIRRKKSKKTRRRTKKKRPLKRKKLN